MKIPLLYSYVKIMISKFLYYEKIYHNSFRNFSNVV